MRGFLILAAVVLVAIGIGVGVESASASAPYGPTGAAFSAAFPATPRLAVRHAGQAVTLYVYSGRGASSRLTVTVVEYRSGWTGYAPLVAVPGSAPLSAVARRARRHGRAFAPPLRPTVIDGQHVTLGAGCAAPGRCAAVLLGPSKREGDHLVDWTASATARSAATARALVASLHVGSS